MKIAIDSNILISAVIFNSPICTKIIKSIPLFDTFVFTEEIIEETLNTILNKFSSDAIKHLKDKKKQMNNLEKIYDTVLIASTLICLSNRKDKYKPTGKIRDKSNEVILDSLTRSHIDIFITGDKDFFERSYHNLRVMTPTQFVTMFVPS